MLKVGEGPSRKTDQLVQRPWGPKVLGVCEGSWRQVWCPIGWAPCVGSEVVASVLLQSPPEKLKSGAEDLGGWEPTSSRKNLKQRNLAETQLL